MSTSGGREPRPRLVMITGPIASGKSSVAGEVARELRAAGLSVALTDLDTVAEMALPTLPDWEWAHGVHARLVGAWMRTGVDWVVDEGTSSPDEVRQVLDELPDGSDVCHVVLTADFEASLARARSEPGRGLSRDASFLRADHDRYASQVAALPCDLPLFVENAGPRGNALRIVERLLG